jgi:hypothetical protein
MLYKAVRLARRNPLLCGLAKAGDQASCSTSSGWRIPENHLLRRMDV